MKNTLLEIVQSMLTALDSENVSSVGDTEEAGMCVEIANRSFEQMITSQRWRHLKQYVELSTSTYDNELVMPSGCYAIDPYNVYYDGVRMVYLSPEDFLSMTIKRDVAESNIAEYNNINIYTDRNPQFFTSDDDYTLRFDAIPDAVNGLVGSDTKAIAWVGPTSKLTSDGQYFDLPPQAFPVLINLCIATAKDELKSDPSGAQKNYRDYKMGMASLGRNARLVDTRDDIRSNIIARKTFARGHIPVPSGWT